MSRKPSLIEATAVLLAVMFVNFIILFPVETSADDEKIKVKSHDSVVVGLEPIGSDLAKRVAELEKRNALLEQNVADLIEANNILLIRTIDNRAYIENNFKLIQALARITVGSDGDTDKRKTD